MTQRFGAVSVPSPLSAADLEIDSVGTATHTVRQCANTPMHQDVGIGMHKLLSVAFSDSLNTRIVCICTARDADTRIRLICEMQWQGVRANALEIRNTGYRRGSFRQAECNVRQSSYLILKRGTQELTVWYRRCRQAGNAAIGALGKSLSASQIQRGCVSRADIINRSSLTSNSYERDNDTRKLRCT